MTRTLFNRYCIVMMVAFCINMGTPRHCAAQQILLNELQDIDLGQVAPTIGDLRSSTRICVSLSEPTTYQVIAQGDGDAGGFSLRSGPYRIPYSVAFSDRRKDRGYQDLVNGVPLLGLKVRGNVNGYCRRNNANVQVTIDAAALLQAAGGSYSGTLTLTVSPE